MNIIGFYPHEHGINRWQRTVANKYARIFNHDTAIQYLTHEIKESIEREVSQIISTRTSFYSAVRFMFAEINALSDLYWNNDNSSHAVRFMRKFGILTPLSGLNYDVFRHGLMHTHMPKWISKGSKVLSWYVSTTNQLPQIFGISIPLLKDQLTSSIDMFICELESEQQSGKNNRLKKFFKCYCRWATIMSKKDFKRYSRGDFKNLGGMIMASRE